MSEKYAAKIRENMPKLNFPDYSFNFKDADKGWMIFDIIRKKHISLTPEEWVRQHLIRYLIQMKYPKGLITSERGVRWNKMNRRYDVAIRDHHGKFILLAECKAPNVKIDEKSLQQITTYNLKLNAEILIISNGLQHYCLKYDEKAGYKVLKNVPGFSAKC